MLKLLLLRSAAFDRSVGRSVARLKRGAAPGQANDGPAVNLCVWCESRKWRMRMSSGDATGSRLLACLRPLSEEERGLSDALTPGLSRRPADRRPIPNTTPTTNRGCCAPPWKPPWRGAGAGGGESVVEGGIVIQGKASGQCGSRPPTVTACPQPTPSSKQNRKRRDRFDRWLAAPNDAADSTVRGSLARCVQAKRHLCFVGPAPSNR